MSYREIADISAMPVGTVMSSLSRARASSRLHKSHERKQNTGVTANNSCERMTEKFLGIKAVCVRSEWYSDGKRNRYRFGLGSAQSA
jgi:hypothetical protein